MVYVDEIPSDFTVPLAEVEVATQAPDAFHGDAVGAGCRAPFDDRRGDDTLASLDVDRDFRVLVVLSRDRVESEPARVLVPDLLETGGNLVGNRDPATLRIPINRGKRRTIEQIPGQHMRSRVKEHVTLDADIICFLVPSRKVPVPGRCARQVTRREQSLWFHGTLLEEKKPIAGRE